MVELLCLSFREFTAELLGVRKICYFTTFQDEVEPKQTVFHV